MTYLSVDNLDSLWRSNYWPACSVDSTKITVWERSSSSQKTSCPRCLLHLAHIIRTVPAANEDDKGGEGDRGDVWKCAHTPSCHLTPRLLAVYATYALSRTKKTVWRFHKSLQPQSHPNLRMTPCTFCSLNGCQIQRQDGLKIFTPYGSVSAGQEFWPFRVIFFQKVEPSCDQTWWDRFYFSIDLGQLCLEDPRNTFVRSQKIFWSPVQHSYFSPIEPFLGKD